MAGGKRDVEAGADLVHRSRTMQVGGGPRPVRTIALRSTASNIAAVSRPVCVFWRETWHDPLYIHIPGRNLLAASARTSPGAAPCTWLAVARGSGVDHAHVAPSSRSRRPTLRA